MDETTEAAYNMTSANATGPPTGGFNPPLNLVLGNQILINLTLFICMIAMGCTMTMGEIKQIARRPVAITVGALCQFGIMPTLGYALAHIFRLTPNMALGTIIVACCPGGLASNIFTYWTEGDTTLSVCMTTASNILGIGMMPWCIYLYSQSWIAISDVVLPQTRDIIIMLVLLFVPVWIGMVIRWKAPKASYKVAAVLNVIVLIGILIFAVISIIAFRPVFDTTWHPYAVAAIYPVCAFALGYFIAWLFRRNKFQCRTIAFETGIQNGALALSLINLLILTGRSSGMAVGEMMIVPLVHSLVALGEGILIVVIYWFFKRLVFKEKGFIYQSPGGLKAQLNKGYQPDEKEMEEAHYYPEKPRMVNTHAQTGFPDD